MSNCSISVSTSDISVSSFFHAFFYFAYKTTKQMQVDENFANVNLSDIFTSVFTRNAKTKSDCF